jgi:predicted RNase H-like HicB family nuclease
MYDDPDEDGWIVARVHQVLGAVSQGRTREEARENVIDALRLMLTPEETNADGSEPLKLPLANAVVARQNGLLTGDFRAPDFGLSPCLAPDCGLDPVCDACRRPLVVERPVPPSGGVTAHAAARWEKTRR